MTKTITFIDPVKEGDTFLGWYTNSDFSGEEITSIPRGSNGNVELYAKWTSNKTSNNDKTSKGCGKASTSFLSLLMILVPAVIFFKKR
mgnify:FL=1